MIGALVAGIALTLALLALWPLKEHFELNDYVAPTFIAIGGVVAGVGFGFFFTIAAKNMQGGSSRLSRKAMAAFALAGIYAFLSPFEIHALVWQDSPATLFSSRTLWLIAVGMGYFAIGGAIFITAIRLAIGRAFSRAVIVACVMLTLIAGLAATATELNKDELMFWHTPFWLVLMAGMVGVNLPVDAKRPENSVAR